MVDQQESQESQIIQGEGSLYNEHYSKKDFWNERFEKTQESFDWYVDWTQLKSHYIKILKQEDNILMVGCGNSKMSEQMYIANYVNITNIDISDVVIKQMNIAYNEMYPKMKCTIDIIYHLIDIEMDATKTIFEDNTFECVIDKGTLDAVMCSDSSEIPSKLINEMYRITKIDGYFSFITHGEPNLRLPFFEKYLLEGTYEVSYEKIRLSFMSNLINSIRNTSKDHSISKGLKDKNLVIASILDAFVNTYQDSELNEDQLKAKKKAALHLKLQAFLKKHEKIKNNEDKDNNSHMNKDSIDTTNDNNKNEEDKSSLSEITTTNSSGNNIRRTHCFLFLFKKIK